MNIVDHYDKMHSMTLTVGPQEGMPQSISETIRSVPQGYASPLQFS